MFKRTTQFLLASTFALTFSIHFLWSAPPGDDWPAWGGPDRNFTVTPGTLNSEQPFVLKVAWKKDLGSGYSAVSVRDQMVVTMFSDSTFDYAIAFDVHDGKELWRFKIDSTFPGRFGSANGPISTPLISDSKVIGLSAGGRLFALDRKSGKLIWDADLIARYEAKIPFYGFSTSPLLYDDILVVETGGASENAISAFDPNTGRVLWTASSDTVEYQSPFLMRSGKTSQFVGITNRALYGLHPATGEVLWTFKHGGTGHPMGAPSGNLVPVSDNQFFLKNTNRGGILLQVRHANEMYEIGEVWKTKAIKGTYVVPVYHDGHLYGYNSRIFACVDVQNGARVWRSRSPGDGFPIVVDGHLIVATKDGRLSVAPASPQGYNEIASLELFDNLVWAPPSYANGRLFLRSMGEIAAVDIVPTHAAAVTDEVSDGLVPDSEFARFITKVEQAQHKTALVDAFMAAQKQFPVIEGDDLVHFVYRGKARDMALMGDLVGWRYDRPMHRVDGTDLFYYSAKLDPDTRLTYKFLKDLQTPVVDSLNTRSIQSMFFGPASWFSMPKWEKPDFLERKTTARSGRIDSLQLQSSITDSVRTVEVYLPAGYDQSTQAYPVAYVHGGRGARTLGQMTTSLDNLIGRRVRPVIAVFMPTFYGGSYREFLGSKRDTYARVFIEEIMPLVEKTYRILPGPENRANIGHLINGFMAFYATFTHRDLFGKLGMQSLYWDEKEAKRHSDLVVPTDQDKLKIYFDWGKYDFRSPLESIDNRAADRSVAALLKKRGFTFSGGEVHDGTGWGSWKTRTDKVFAILFPVSDPKGK